MSYCSETPRGMSWGFLHRNFMKDLIINEKARIGKYCVIEGTEETPVVIEKDVVIKDYVKIYPDVHIKSNSIIEEHCILGHPTKHEMVGRDDTQFSEKIKDKIIENSTTIIGNNSLIRSNSIVYRFVYIGDNFQSGHHVLIREHTLIGNNVIFGSYASCDGFTRIGSYTQIGQYVMLAQSATIGNYCFIGGHTVFSDNKYVIGNVEYDLNGSIVEDYVRIGLNCCIFPDVRIGTDSMIGMNTLLNKSIHERKLAYGNPVKIIRDLAENEISLYKKSKIQ